MSSQPEVLNATELMDRLGISHQTYARHKRMGKFKHLEITRPVGQRRYSKQLVDLMLAGQSTVQIGRRA